MISTIRNVYVRRVVLVLYSGVFFPLMFMVAVLTPIENYVRDRLLDDVRAIGAEMRECWRVVREAWRA